MNNFGVQWASFNKADTECSFSCSFSTTRINVLGGEDFFVRWVFRSLQPEV